MALLFEVGMTSIITLEAMRNIVSGRAVSLSALMLSAGLALSYVLLAGWFFTRIYKPAFLTLNRQKADFCGITEFPHNS